VSAIVPGVLFMQETPTTVEDAALVIGAILIGAFPLVQLGASLTTLILLAVAPANVIPEKGEALRALGRITLWSFVGAIGACSCSGRSRSLVFA